MNKASIHNNRSHWIIYSVEKILLLLLSLLLFDVKFFFSRCHSHLILFSLLILLIRRRFGFAPTFHSCYVLSLYRENNRKFINSLLIYCLLPHRTLSLIPSPLTSKHRWHLNSSQNPWHGAACGMDNLLSMFCSNRNRHLNDNLNKQNWMWFCKS